MLPKQYWLAVTLALLLIIILSLNGLKMRFTKHSANVVEGFLPEWLINARTQLRQHLLRKNNSRQVNQHTSQQNNTLNNNLTPSERKALENYRGDVWGIETYKQLMRHNNLNGGNPFADSYKNFCVLRNHYNKCEYNSNKCKDECPPNKG